MLAVALAAASGLSPAIDRPYRIVLSEDRVQAGVTHRYELERRLVFRRERGELVAELTLVRVRQDVGGAAGQRFEAAAGALRGRTLRLRLAADGAVRSIDDEAGLWTATVAGIAAAASAHPPGSPAATLAHDPAAAFAAMPPERRRATLAMPFTSLVAEGDLAPGSGPVSLGGGIVPGRQLAGTRTVTVGADTRTHVVVHATTDEGTPVTLDRERAIDTATGLVVDTRETQTTGRGEAMQIVRQHVTVEALVP